MYLKKKKNIYLLGWHVGSGSLIRDGTQTRALGAQTLSHWTTREGPAPFKTRVNANMNDLDFLRLFFIGG